MLAATGASQPGTLLHCRVYNRRYRMKKKGYPVSEYPETEMNESAEEQPRTRRRRSSSAAAAERSSSGTAAWGRAGQKKRKRGRQQVGPREWKPRHGLEISYSVFVQDLAIPSMRQPPLFSWLHCRWPFVWTFSTLVLPLEAHLQYSCIIRFVSESLPFISD